MNRNKYKYRQNLWIRPNQKIQYKKDTNILQIEIQIWKETNTNTWKLSEYDLISKYNKKKTQILYKCKCKYLHKLIQMQMPATSLNVNSDDDDDGDDDIHNDNKCSIEICSTVRKAS